MRVFQLEHFAFPTAKRALYRSADTPAIHWVTKRCSQRQEDAGLAFDGKVSLYPTRLRVGRRSIAVRIAGEAIHFYFVPGKILLGEVGKPAGNWYSVQHFLAAFLSFFVVYKDKIFYSRNSA